MQGSSDKFYWGVFNEGTLEDLGGVVTWSEGLEGKTQGAEKPGMFEELQGEP
mgnify:CR=1 FL=1